MHLSLWKPISHCASLFLVKKCKRGEEYNSDEEDTISRESRERKLREAIKEASEKGTLLKSQEIDVEIMNEDENLGNSSYRSLARLYAQHNFLSDTAYAAEQVYTTVESIPEFGDTLHRFLAMYTKYQTTEQIDNLRNIEYKNLSDRDGKICLDYCGFGLFSYYQTLQFWESSAFKLTEIRANLTNHALYGGAEEGTIEHTIRARIMDYLNVPRNEYAIVFTVSRGSAFKLLAESYPFHINKRLLTMYDHESQSVNWMVQCATEKGAEVYNAWFKYPTLKLCSTELKKQILKKKKGKKSGPNGLLVFPVQSRVSGSKYSYQWMGLAQRNNWHVLLDAGSLGPKDMDSLGLSLFRPDFIITSFYKVFGYDPSGFGCLLIKRSAMRALHTPSGQTGTGIVRIVPEFPQYLDDSTLDGSLRMSDVVVDESDEIGGSRTEFPVFSGGYTAGQIQDVFETEMERDSVSVGEIMRSPISSDDGSADTPFWIDLGQSPLGSDHSDHIPLSVRTHKKRSPKLALEDSKTSFYKDTILSFDDTFKGIPEKSEIIEENYITRENSYNGYRGEDSSEIRTFEPGEASNTGRENEGEIVCRHLDHVDMLGLNKTTLRLRYLINWLVVSLLQLQFPESENGNKVSLVQIYGPKIKYERGAAVALNVRDSRNGGMVHPEIVQKLAEREGIFLGVGILSHVRGVTGSKNHGIFGTEDKSLCKAMANDRGIRKDMLFRVEVVTASLGFLTDFKDVYRMYAFIAKFLNSSFVEEDRLSTVMEDIEEA